MKILVVGAGALGGMVGAHLTESGEDTTIIEINAARARLISDTGLFLTEGRKERNIPMQVVTSVEGLPVMDLIFVSVKSYQTEAAVRGLLPVVGDHTKMLSLQNGIGNTATMAEIIGPQKVLCGITYHSIQHIGPNRLRFRRGIKPIQIAPYDGNITPEIQAIGEMFNRCGLETEVVANVDDATWQKLLHNAVVNPVSAVTGPIFETWRKAAELASSTAAGSSPKASRRRFMLIGPIDGSPFRTRNACRRVNSVAIFRAPECGRKVI